MKLILTCLYLYFFNKNTMKITIISIISFFLFFSCINDHYDAISEKKFNNLLEEYNEGILLLNPLKATFAGDNRFNDQFPNFLSVKYQEKLKLFYNSFRKRLSQINDKNLSKDQIVSKKIIEWECDISLAQANFKNDILIPIDQMWTVNLTMGQLASANGAQPFNTVKDYENWLKRLEKYNDWLNSAKIRMKVGIQSGYTLPKALIKKVIPQFESLINININTKEELDVKKHLFYAPIIKFPNDFTDSERAKLTKKYSYFLTNKLIPSFKRLHTFLSTDYLNAGRKTSGINDIPEGKKYYQHSIKKYTTTDMTADEIHELGLKEVSRILSEMNEIKNQVNFKGNIKDFFDFVRNKKELMPYSKASQVLDHFNDIHEKMKPQLEKLFGSKPKTPFIVKQTEKFREASASAEYNAGSLDGSRPGIFYTPIPNPRKYNIFTDEALFLHEAIPGHHYQISLTQENKKLPKFRKTQWYSAYGEGWALYTENLGKDLGLYKDHYQYFGMLSMEMHRAIRLVVDTGIHAKGWTREQAIQYSLDNEAESESSIISEIERYMANPGQALSYKIGQLKILELRAKAMKELGSKFNIKEFHNQILETGCIPLALLEDKINKWILSNQKQTN